MDYIPLVTSKSRSIRKCKRFSNRQKRKYDQSHSKLVNEGITLKGKIQIINYNKLIKDDFCSLNGIANPDTTKTEPDVSLPIITSRNLPKDLDMSNATKEKGEKLNFESKLENRIRQHLKENQSKVCNLKSLCFGNYRTLSQL